MWPCTCNVHQGDCSNNAGSCRFRYGELAPLKRGVCKGNPSPGCVAEDHGKAARVECMSDWLYNLPLDGWHL